MEKNLHSPYVLIARYLIKDKNSFAVYCQFFLSYLNGSK
jgi:hypothetical protein